MSKSCPDCGVSFTDEGEIRRSLCKKCEIKKIVEEQEKEKKEIEDIKNTYSHK